MPVDILDLDGAVLHTVQGQNNLRNANLNGLNLRRANLAGLNLNGSTFVDTNLRFSDCTDATFVGCDFSDANLNDCIMIRANLNQGLGQNGTMRRTNLTDAKMNNADFQRTKFVGAILTGLRATDTDLHESKFQSTTDEPPVDTVATNINLNRSNLCKVNFRNTDVTGSTMRNCNLTGANLNQANLTNVDFTGANITSMTVRNATLTATTNFNNVVVSPPLPPVVTELSSSEDLRKLYNSMNDAADLANFPAVWDGFYSRRQKPPIGE